MCHCSAMNNVYMTGFLWLYSLNEYSPWQITMEPPVIVYLVLVDEDI